MKKIIIVNNNMKVGGIQKSLCNLLWSIHGRYDVTLLLFQAVGDYMNQIPADPLFQGKKGILFYKNVKCALSFFKFL